MILTISPSSIETWQECPTKYNYGTVKRLSPIDEDTTKMDRGRLFHEMLQLHYTLLKEGVTYNDIILEVTKSSREKYVEEDFSVQMIEECIKNYQEYAVYYQNDGWKVLAVESPFSVVVYESDEHKIILEGRIDLIVENDGMTIPVDHKTSDKQEKPNPLSNQFMSYSFVANSFNFIKNEIGFQKTYGPAQRFHRHVLSYPEENLIEWKDQIVRDGLKIIQAIETAEFEMRFASCWRCRFRKICESTPDARNFKIESMYKVRDEYNIYK